MGGLVSSTFPQQAQARQQATQQSQVQQQLQSQQDQALLQESADYLSTGQFSSNIQVAQDTVSVRSVTASDQAKEFVMASKVIDYDAEGNPIYAIEPFRRVHFQRVHHPYMSLGQI